MNQSRVVATAAAVVFLVLFVVALGVRFWASGKAAEIVGPDHIAAGAERVYVHVNGELLVLSDAGELVERRRTPALIGGESLIDMRVLDDGRLLLARRLPSALFECDPASWVCNETARAIAGKFHDQFKVAFDPASGGFYFSDFTGRLWHLPQAEAEPKRMATDSRVDHPNDIALDEAGRLWIADSGNHRLVAYQRGDGDQWKLSYEHDARNPFADAMRSWPMMLVMASDGNWWVAQPDPRGQRADLVIYHPERGAIAKVPLPEGGEPVDLARAGDAMIVTDRDRFRLYRVEVASRSAVEFGDAHVRAVLAHQRKLRSRFESGSDGALVALIVFGVLMVLAAFMATPRDQRWTKQETAPPLVANAVASGPVLGHVHWLKRHSKTERFLRWAAPLGTFMPLVMLAMFAGLYFLIGDPDEAAGPRQREKAAELEQTFLFIAVFLGGLPLLLQAGIRNMRHRLGTDGRQLYARLADGKQIAIAPEKFVYNQRVIAFQEFVFPVQTGKKQPLYLAGEIETFVIPLLQRGRRLGAWEMLQYQWAHRERTLMFMLGYGAILIVVAVATGAWRPLFKGFL